MRTLCLASALFLASCTTITITDKQFFHPGPARNPATLSSSEGTIQSDPLIAGDGTTLGTVYMTDPAADVEILYFGGDSFRIDDFGAEVVRIVTPLHVNLFMTDYRGYGRSGGVPGVAALKSDALAAFDHLRARSGTRPIVVHGFSLGSFMAAHVAANRPVAGLILESTAPDVAQWARAQIPLYAKPFVRLKLAPTLLQESNARALEAHRQPLLVITGADDPVTPTRFATSLVRSSPSANKRAVIVKGASHGNVMTFPAAQEEYARFLNLVRGKR